MLFKTERGIVNIMNVTSIHPFSHKSEDPDYADTHEIEFYTVSGSKEVARYKTQEEYERDLTIIESLCLNTDGDPLTSLMEPQATVPNDVLEDDTIVS